MGEDERMSTYSTKVAMQQYAGEILRKLPMINRARNKAELECVMKEILELLGECSGAERIYIYDKKRGTPVRYEKYFEWWNLKKNDRKDTDFICLETEIPNWSQAFCEGATIVIRDRNEILESMPLEYEKLKQRHVNAVILVPIYSRNQLDGFIGLDNPYNNISELLIQQVAFVGAHLNSARENLRMFHLLEENVEKLERERQILMILCEDSTSVFKVNLINDTAEVIKIDSETNVSTVLFPEDNTVLSYSKEMKRFYDKFVVKESAKDYLKIFDVENLKKELSQKERISSQFEMIPNAKGQQYFEIRATRISQTDENFQILLDFRHIDEIIAEEKKHQKELKEALDETQKNNEIISAIGKIYFSIYHIDIQNECFKELSNKNKIYQLSQEPGKQFNEIVEDNIKSIAKEFSDSVKEFLDISTLNKRLKEKESVSIEYMMLDGDWHLARFIVQARDENKNPKDVLLAIRLISEEKKKEKYLRGVADNANQANEAKSEFLSRMSHDIRTPMNAIMGFTNIAKHNMEDSEKVQECLDKIQLSGKNLQQLIDDVLDVSKIESGELKISLRPSKVSDIYKSCHEIISVMIEEGKLNYFENIHDILHDVVIVDELRLIQIYMNLLSNAIKYTQEGGTVSFEIYQEEILNSNKVRLISIVSDTGIGMSPEFMKDMYSKFSRAVDTRVNKIRGTGLGLAIVKEIIEQMGGTIEATSKLYEGTRFKVVLEVAFAGDNEIEQPEKNEQAGVSSQKLKLLIAEDNDFNYEILEEQLKAFQVECVRAEDGIECIKKFEASKEKEYDAILMDMQMPEMGGLEATTVIRNLSHPMSRTIPIIALTANAYQEDAEKCLAAGMNAHLSKPVEVEDVIRMVRKYLREKRKK